MAISIPFEPEEVLEVPPSASLEQIRSAYHEKAKRHHPDAGGEPWAFRIVTHSYEHLTMQRMAHRLREEEAREEERQRPPRPEPAPRAPRQPPTEVDETAPRRALRDDVADAGLLVDVEVLTVRYELSDPTQFLFSKAEDRTLSCCLNVVWPSRESTPTSAADHHNALPIVAGAFRSLVRKTRAASSHIHDLTDSFSGWVSYPTLTRASEAFDAFHGMLKEHGLGAAQWMRDVIIPRV